MLSIDRLAFLSAASADTSAIERAEHIHRCFICASGNACDTRDSFLFIRELTQTLQNSLVPAKLKFTTAGIAVVIAWVTPAIDIGDGHILIFLFRAIHRD